MNESPEKPKLLQVVVPQKVDLMRYFARNCAAVKLVALTLVVIRDWGVVILATGTPVAVYVVSKQLM